MAQTTRGALKALVDGLALVPANYSAALVAYGDRAPQGIKRPYVELLEEVALVPDLRETGRRTAVETAQVDLFQDFRDLDGSVTGQRGKLLEDVSLAPALKSGIDGARAGPVGSSVVYIVLLRHSNRVVDEAENVVHHMLQVELFRQL